MIKNCSNNLKIYKFKDSLITLLNIDKINRIERIFPNLIFLQKKK